MRGGRVVTGHEDRDTSAVMITAPVVDELGSPPSHEDRAGRVHFVEQCSGRSGRPEELPVWSEGPLVQPVAIIATAVVVGVGDGAVERHRHVEH